jgi:hypothetical protein
LAGEEEHVSRLVVPAGQLVRRLKHGSALDVEGAFDGRGAAGPLTVSYLVDGRLKEDVHHEGYLADLTSLVEEVDGVPVLAGGYFVLPDELLEVVLAEVIEELDQSFVGHRLFLSRLLLFATSLVSSILIHFPTPCL